MKARITTAMIAAAACPPGKKYAPLWDLASPGLAVLVYSTGTKVWAVNYRPGKGRQFRSRWHRLDSVERIGPAEARLAAKHFFGEIARGVNPAAERAEQKAEEKALKAAALGTAIDDYERELTRRKLVKRAEVISVLRRELRDKLGTNADLRQITRQKMVTRLEEIAKSRPGASAYLRKASTGFFDWLANKGAIPVSPLAGYRKPRRSRAETIEQPGRALADDEVKAIWRATENRFGALVRLGLLTGCRRGEAAAMEWRDLDQDAGTWLIRAEVAKTGRARFVYLAPLAVEILRNVPVISGVPLVFPSDVGTAITGWTKRVAAVVKDSGVDFTMHDTRRTFRTGLSRLGVDRDTAELCLGHWRGDLVEAYDRDTAEPRQREAVTRWARHVEGLLGRGAGNVHPLRREAS